jgi:hypothetical protein
MDVESPNARRGRPLHVSERELVRTMLMKKYSADPVLDAMLASSVVEEMQDGGMGSIRFLSPGGPKAVFGKTTAEAEYTDDDGVLVTIVINTDEKGELYEVGFWKVDFTPLKRYPAPSDLKLHK